MGCVKLHILDEQYKRTELQVSYFNKELTSNFCAENARKVLLYAYCANNPVNNIDPDGRQVSVLEGAYQSYKLYRAYRAVQAARAVATTMEVAEVATVAAAATTATVYSYNYFLSPKQDAKAQQSFFDMLKDYAPGYAEQEKQGKRAKEELDRQQANIQNSINNNVGEPSPDGTPDPKDRGGKTGAKVGVVVGGTVAAGVIGVVVSHPQKKDNNQNKQNDKNEEVKERTPEDENNQTYNNPYQNYIDYLKDTGGF